MPEPGPDAELIDFTAADAVAVAELTVACDRASLPWASSGWRPPSFEYERDWWRQRLDRPEYWSRGVREGGGRLVGFVSMHPSTEPGLFSTRPTGHVTALFVHPERWREGLGARLLGLAEAEIRERGWTFGRLLTPAWSPARDFYAAQGWLEDGMRDHIEELDLDVVGLVKPL